LLKELVTRVAQGIGDKDCSRNWWQGLLRSEGAQSGGKGCSEVKVLRVVARIAQGIGALKLGSNEGLGRAKSLSAN
jgi:hypothetical protein